MEVATAFYCNLSQMTKAETGVNYKGGPHHYKPKPKQKTATKRSCDSTDLNPAPAKKVKTKQGQPSTSQQADTIVKEDTLSSSSSSCDDELSPGL